MNGQINRRVKELSSRAQRKFNEWAEKVRVTLQSDDETALNSLPTKVRWLHYWGQKLRKKEPRIYVQVEKTEVDLVGKSGIKLNDSYLSYLKKAQRHKKGTKVRLVEIQRYAYHYSNYAHTFLIAGRKENEAKEILKSYWGSYLNEIVRHRKLLEDYQIEWILQLVKHSEDIGVKLDERKISKLRARLSKLEFLFTFFNVKELVQMAKELSHQETRWRFKRRPRGLLVQSIVRNTTVEEIEEYIRKGIINKEIPPIQANRSGWILGPIGLLKSTYARKSIMMEDLTKFLLRHVNYPSPYLELKDKLGDRLALTINKSDPLIKEKICQLLLAKLSDEEIFKIFNQLINKGSLKIASIERYWNFVATPFGVFELGFAGEEYLARVILKTFRKEELRPRAEGDGTIEDLILQECIVKPPNEILAEFFGFGPYLIKLAKRIGLFGLDEIENEKLFVQAILLKLGFDVPQELQGIVSLTSKSEGHLKEVKSGSPLTEGSWNVIYRLLERILEDLVLFYGSVWHEQKLRGLEEEKRETEIKSWIRKKFKLKKQFDYLTLGDLCALLRDMNSFSKTNRRVRGLMIRLFRRDNLVKGEHLKELDFIKGCRTELTKIHRRRGGKRCEQRDVLERLTALLRDWISEKGLSRTYPYSIRLKETVTTEFGVRYCTVVNEEGRIRKLKTDEWIKPEDTWFMISRNDRFPIDPILVKKYW